MGQSYFIWKGIDCRNMGVRLDGPVPVVRPEERVEHVTIPGRSGDLTETEGENIFNSYIQTATILVHGAFRLREIWKWLRGAGYVTFSGEPDRKQQARIIGAVTLNKHSYNLDWWTGEVQFYCQPLKEKLRSETQTVTASGATVLNAGDVESRPVITMTASGTLATVSAGGNTILCMNLTSGHVYELDAEVQEMIDVTTPGSPVSMTNETSGYFPVLQPGNNTVTGSGWSQLVIDKRERFL